VNKPIRILIVDDHFLVRIGLVTALQQNPGFDVVAEAGTGLQAIELYRLQQPDVVVMELRLPDGSGLEVTAALCREFPKARIILVSSFATVEQIGPAFQAGARGFLLKDVLAEELVRAVKAVAAGEPYVAAEITRAALPERVVGNSRRKSQDRGQTFGNSV
jgi:DNA-binding NarL/FixJ family response regulator